MSRAALISPCHIVALFFSQNAPYQLSRNRLSDNVGVVKSVVWHPLLRKRHFALVEKIPSQPTTARLVILSGQETRSDPCISSIATPIMITSSNSSVKRSGVPTQLLGVLLHTMAISGLPRVRTELDPLLIIPALAQHPVQTNCQPPCHGDLGDLSSSPHHQGKVSAAPLRKATHRNLRCLHQ